MYCMCGGIQGYDPIPVAALKSKDEGRGRRGGKKRRSSKFGFRPPLTRMMASKLRGAGDMFGD